MSSRRLGTLLIAIAASLWATDSLFRAPTSLVLNPVLIVLFEHVFGTIALLVWVFLRYRAQMTGYSPKTWLAFLVIGAGGSAIATVLFTASFKYGNPSVTILLQKLQPLMVVIFASVFLGEKPSRGFWKWGALALAAAIGVSFPDFNFNFLRGDLSHSKGVSYALIAALIWALSTVAGKSLPSSLPNVIPTFWRYAFGLVTLLVLAVFTEMTIPLSVLHYGPILRALVYITLFPGIIALLFYYSGLKRATAISATFTELIFPIAAVLLNWIFLGSALNTVQLISGAILLFAIAQVSIALK
jgi:drug/metabolite transporter (DMT)-like permease